MKGDDLVIDNGESHTPASKGALVLIPPTEHTLAIQADHELKAAKRFAHFSKAAATRRAYVSDWGAFVRWCTDRQLEALPASCETAARYLSVLAEAGKKVSTIRRAMSAITFFHRLQEYEPPINEAVRAVMAGIRRQLGVRVDKKAPVTVDLVRKMIRLVPGTLIGARDRALLLVGFAGAFRRSELVALTVEDLERHNDGLLLHIRKSKTDQEGAGRQVAIPRGGKLHVAEALEAWLGAASITTGPLFRAVDRHGRIADRGLDDQSVATIVKRYATRVGMDPDGFGAHSLRSGFVTSALESGADALRVMDVTGHKDVRTLKGYDRRAKFAKHAGRAFL